MKRKPSAVATALGWLTGALTAVLVNFALFHVIGGDYPVELTSFAGVVVGGFGGMALADRMGSRGIRPLAITVGLLLAVVVGAVFLVLSDLGR